MRRFTVRQFVIEVHGVDEEGSGDFGRRFVEEANRIGIGEGLGPVTERHRAGEPERLPLAKYWPHVVRKEGYYGDDVSQDVLDLACGTNHAIRRGRPAPPTLGLLELLLFRLNDGQIDRTKELLLRHIERLEKDRLRSRPRLQKAEEGKQDVDGTPMLLPTFNPSWSTWNNGIVRKIAEAIQAHRDYSALPILADALEDAGCPDSLILKHLRYPMEHTCRCWVLRELLKTGGRMEGKSVSDEQTHDQTE